MSSLASQNTLKSSLVDAGHEPIKVIWIQLQCDISLVVGNCVSVEIPALRCLNLIFNAINFNPVNGVIHTFESVL
jgi:hypothetical protein